MAKILIVDDDQPFAREVAGYLKTAGHACTVAANGEQALAILDKEQMDLLILDVMFPGMSGFEICRRIHANANLYTLPILFLSAMNGEEEIAHGLAQGGDDFLTKPIQRDVLINRVQHLLTLCAPNRMVDEATSLPGPRHIKLEVHRIINLHRDFAVLYIELIRLNEFVRACGAEAREKAVRHLARGLRLCGEELNMNFFSVGHMGGGHFMAVLDAQQVEKYCNLVLKLWNRHLPAFLQSLESAPAGARDVSLDLLFCGVIHEAASQATAQDLFETLTRLRKKAVAAGATGLFIDRRR